MVRRFTILFLVMTLGAVAPSFAQLGYVPGYQKVREWTLKPVTGFQEEVSCNWYSGVVSAFVWQVSVQIPPPQAIFSYMIEAQGYWKGLMNKEGYNDWPTTTILSRVDQFISTSSNIIWTVNKPVVNGTCVVSVASIGVYVPILSGTNTVEVTNTYTVSNVVYYTNGAGSTNGWDMGEHIFTTNELGYICASNLVDAVNLQTDCVRDSRMMLAWMIGLLLCLIIAKGWEHVFKMD